LMTVTVALGNTHLALALALALASASAATFDGVGNHTSDLANLAFSAGVPLSAGWGCSSSPPAPSTFRNHR
jgi:hypothetical protein